MAIVKVNTIHQSLDKAIANIIDQRKTDGGRLVEANYSPYANEPLQLADMMLFSLERSANGIRKGTVLARHLIQYFHPDDDIEAETAMRIGIEFTEEITDGKYQYVLATHVGERSLCNHAIICNASDVTGLKMRMDRNTLREWRTISDRICKQNSLHTISPSPTEPYGELAGKTLQHPVAKEIPWR